MAFQKTSEKSGKIAATLARAIAVAAIVAVATPVAAADGGTLSVPMATAMIDMVSAADAVAQVQETAAMVEVVTEADLSSFSTQDLPDGTVSEVTPTGFERVGEGTQSVLHDLITGGEERMTESFNEAFDDTLFPGSEWGVSQPESSNG